MVGSVLIAACIGVGFDFNRTALLFHRKVFGLLPRNNAYTAALAGPLRYHLSATRAQGSPALAYPIGCQLPYSVHPIWHDRPFVSGSVIQRVTV